VKTVGDSLRWSAKQGMNRFIASNDLALSGLPVSVRKNRYDINEKFPLPHLHGEA
jgi:hypothetical protein